MTDQTQNTAPSGWKGLPLRVVGLVFIACVAVYGWFFLHAESEIEVVVLLLVGVGAAWIASKSGASQAVNQAMGTHSSLMNAGVIVAIVAVIFSFSTEHFPLLMLTTVLLYLTAALGLNVQFGYTGMVNFSGAAFFGIGAYTSAVLTMNSPIPSLLILVLGGVIAMAVGLVLILPVIRTRGHYSAVVTIAFSVMFTTFLQVNDVLGGPQGLAVGSMTLFGWDFNNSPVLFGIEMSFYVNYALMGTVVAGLAFMFTRRLERSWLGLTLDSVRLDETASACFGIGVRRAKVLAFSFGNFMTGLAGALYGMMISFIAPTSFTFSDSLLLVAIVLLGGMGSPWGTALAAFIVIVLPEKLQVIQEYRFLLFSVLVITMLLFRPDGLLPRQVRAFIPGWRNGQ